MYSFPLSYRNVVLTLPGQHLLGLLWEFYLYLPSHELLHTTYMMCPAGH